MNHVGLDFTFLNPESGSSPVGQAQAGWRGDFLAQLFSFNPDLKQYLGVGALEGIENVPPFNPTVEQDHPVPTSEADQEISPGLASASHRAEGDESRVPQADTKVTLGRGGSVPFGTSTSTHSRGFELDLRGWVQGRATAWHLTGNPAQPFRTAAVGDNEGLGNVVRAGGKPGIVEPADRPEVSEPDQKEMGRNPRSPLNQLNPSAGARHDQIPQDRLWIPNASARLAARAEGRRLDGTGEFTRIPTASPFTSAPRSRPSSTARSNNPGRDGIQGLQETRATAISPQAAAQNSARAAEIPFQSEAQRTSATHRAVVERVGQEQPPSVESRPESGSEWGSKTGLKRHEIAEFRPGFLSDVPAKGANSPDREALRAQMSLSPKQAPPAESAGSLRDNPSGVDQERRLGTGTRSQGFSQASNGSPRAIEPSASPQGLGGSTTTRSLTGTAETHTQMEQPGRSGEDLVPQARPDDATRKSAGRGPEEDGTREHRPVRVDRESGSQSPVASGVKVPLPPSAAAVQSEWPVGRRPVNWVRQMGGDMLDAEGESTELEIPTKKVQEGTTQAGRTPARMEPEATLLSALEDRILREGLGSRRTLPESQSNPVRFQPVRSDSDILKGRSEPEVPVSRVLEQSDPLLDQNARSVVAGWAGTPVVLEKELRGESRGRQRNSLPVNGALSQTTRPVLKSPEPVERIQGRQALPSNPEEPLEAEPDTREPRKTFAETEQEDSDRPVLSRRKSSETKDSSDRVWGESSEKLGVVQAGRPGGRGYMTSSPKATSLDARDSSQAPQVAYSSSSRSSSGLELSQQGTPAWLKSPTALVDAVANPFVQHSRFLKGGETLRFEIQLQPEFLGKIRIKTSLSQQKELAVEIEVDDPKVREVLEQRLPALMEKLQGMGVEPDRLKVDGFSSQSQFDAQQEEGQRREQPTATKSWSRPNPDEAEEDLPDRPELDDDEGIHYFA